MRFGSGDPGLQKKREARLVEPPGGFHSYVNVLHLQFGLADMCVLGHRAISIGQCCFAAASGTFRRVLRILDQEGSLLDGPVVDRTGWWMVNHYNFGKAAGSKLKIHVENDEEGEN